MNGFKKRRNFSCSSRLRTIPGNEPSQSNYEADGEISKTLFFFFTDVGGFENKLACFSLTVGLRFTAIYLFTKICSRKNVFTAINGNIFTGFTVVKT